MDLMARRRQIMMAQVQNDDGNLFDISDLWNNGETIGSGETFQYYGLSLPNGSYVVSTDVPDNTNASVASVAAQINVGVPISSRTGVFLNSPRTVTVDGGILYVYIRIASSQYLTWNETSFAPYYIKVESA